MPVPAQEAVEPQDIAIARPADDDRARAAFDQPDPAQDERAHDPLAQLGLGHQQRPQLFGGDDQHLHR